MREKMSNRFRPIPRVAALVAAGVLGAALTSSAQPVTVNMEANQTTVAGAPMWVFDCASVDPGPCEKAGSAIAPVIRVASGDDLTVNLDNNLAVPVSLVMAGQASTSWSAPRTVTDGQGRARVMAFSGNEAAPGGLAQPTSWTGLKPGTYLIQSGTQPSIQVQMGLSAVVVVDEAPGVAYPDPDSTGPRESVPYDQEIVLVYSEIDTAMHVAIQAAVAANPGSPDYPSTIDYSPDVFLVNGVVGGADEFSFQSDAFPASGRLGLLVRMANAGLQTHVPSILGIDDGASETHFDVVAEDGNRYPFGRRKASVLLSPAKTVDAVIGLEQADGYYAIYDQMLDAGPSSGMLAYLQVMGGSPSPVLPPPTPSLLVAQDDDLATGEDVELTLSACDSGVLANDTVGAQPACDGGTIPVAFAVTYPESGTLTLNEDGSLSYVPYANFQGNDGFSYAFEDGGLYSNAAKVTIHVEQFDDAPVATSDGPYYNATVGGPVSVAAPGVLANDVDPEGDAIYAGLDLSACPNTAGAVLAADGSFTASSSGTFCYRARDKKNENGAQPGDFSEPVEVRVAFRDATVALSVVDTGGAPITDFRWVLEEDVTFAPDPSQPPPTDPDAQLATSFHKSYMPVVAQGCVGANADACGDETVPLGPGTLPVESGKRYFVSVLPADAGGGAGGHEMGGAAIAAGQTNVTVVVNSQPLEGAQISILVFEDDNPTNGVWDEGEAGLCDTSSGPNSCLGSFQVLLEDGGGRYGIAAGLQNNDKDGLPLRNALPCAPDAAPGVVLTCPDGRALIQNLAPAKYGILVVPPAAEAHEWVQTSTIEGTKVIDAWVKAGEPSYFREFGPPGWHVAVGFVNPGKMAAARADDGIAGTGSVSGTVTNLRLQRPSSVAPSSMNLVDSGSHDALAHAPAMVGLNSAGGVGRNYWAVEADENGSFQIDGIAPGSYQLVVWDKYLDTILAFEAVDVGTEGVDLGNVEVLNWFSRLENHVFVDLDEDGVRDPGETPLLEQNINLRWRDGTVYKAIPTDGEGNSPFDEVFPFFHWLVAEVDFATHKATGATITVDAGGMPTDGILNPQKQDDGTGQFTLDSRTETGPVLTQGFQTFLGQTSRIDWGKKPYGPGENGGISGIVYYAITRAEGDPRLAAAEPWEPGIPRVEVRLYREEEVTQGNTTSVVRTLVATARTDSWDDSLPTGCPPGNPIGGEDPKADPFYLNGRCYDGLRNFNQVRPGVFDGGYAFDGLAPGTYIVQVVPPPGYTLLKEEDKNVDFGVEFVTVETFDGSTVTILPGETALSYAPLEPGLAQPECVGDPRIVPQGLSLFAGDPAPFAGYERPLCDAKRVVLADRANGVADFFLFTQTPIAAHGVGMILDDTAQEFNPASVQFGEKWAPPFVPISIRDWSGRELGRVHSDAYGRFNFLAPSTFTTNLPAPSGMGPQMLTACMNDPGDPPDPAYNARYNTFCYTLQYMPGSTTYLDTPVLPSAAFAAGDEYPLDCELPAETPRIASVSPLSVGASTGMLTLTSVGTLEIPNPAWTGPSGTEPLTIPRDFSFGTQEGTVSVGSLTADPEAVTWSAETIQVDLAALPLSQGTYPIRVTTSAGRSTVAAATFTVTGGQQVIDVTPGPGAIQAAIEAADPGALIRVGPGTYDELVIMWKPVQLQGAGEGSTIINAAKRPAEKLAQWREKIDLLTVGRPDDPDTPLVNEFVAPVVDPLPGQAFAPSAGVGLEPDTLGTEEGAGITVLADTSSFEAAFQAGRPARIDGFTITGGDTGGAIYVNGWAHHLTISNNRLVGNTSTLGGAVRIGRPNLELAEQTTDPFGFNRDVEVSHNIITQNAARGGVGGGVSICTGSDVYSVVDNWICGNFTEGDGAGIGHVGLSPGGTIARNTILFNQSFNQQVQVSGGGIFVGGRPADAGLSGGSGSVEIFDNLIQGNHAASGFGGGIRTQFVNGFDVESAPGNSAAWYAITLEGNVILNNVAGHAGGGVALLDTVQASVTGNTIANNDSTATVGSLLASPSYSNQVAGLVSQAHSAALAILTAVDFSDPIAFDHNVLWHNRSLYYDGAAVGGPTLMGDVGGCGEGTTFWDLGVIGGGSLSPVNSLLTDTAGYDPTNVSVAPGFDDACNMPRTRQDFMEMTTIPSVQPAPDEGGQTWIDVRYTPISAEALRDDVAAGCSAGVCGGGVQ